MKIESFKNLLDESAEVEDENYYYSIEEITDELEDIFDDANKMQGDKDCRHKGGNRGPFP